MNGRPCAEELAGDAGEGGEGAVHGTGGVGERGKRKEKKKKKKLEPTLAAATRASAHGSGLAMRAQSARRGVMRCDVGGVMLCKNRLYSKRRQFNDSFVFFGLAPTGFALDFCKKRKNKEKKKTLHIVLRGGHLLLFCSTRRSFCSRGWIRGVVPVVVAQRTQRRVVFAPRLPDARPVAAVLPPAAPTLREARAPSTLAYNAAASASSASTSASTHVAADPNLVFFFRVLLPVPPLLYRFLPVVVVSVFLVTGVQVSLVCGAVTLEREDERPPLGCVSRRVRVILFPGGPPLNPSEVKSPS